MKINYENSKKMCIFVEGQTEQIFIKKLIQEIASIKEVTVELFIARGGNKVERNISQIDQQKEKKRFYIQIVDSGTDNRVVSDVLDNADKLEKANFKKILGIRDLYPIKIDKLDKLKNICNREVSQLAIESKIHIVVKEIETWFLKEYSHLEKVDSRLTKEYIKNLGFDLEEDDLEMDDKYNKPSEVLKMIYQSVSRTYNKEKKRVEGLVEELDYEKLYIEIRLKLKSLNEFIIELDSFFTNA